MASFTELSYNHLLPDEKMDVDEKNLRLFFDTMYRRQELWYNKNVLKKTTDLTTDKWFKDFKFTNVYRELDRSSQYLIRNSTLTESSLKQIFFSILIFRVINKPETIERLGGFPRHEDFNLNKFIASLKKLEDSGFKTLNDDAYKINTYVWQGEPRWLAYAKNIIGVYYSRLDIMFDIVKNSGKIEDVLSTLKIFGVGSFLIHEYYQDFCDVNIYTGREIMKFNRNSYTNVGPGCSLGLRLIFPSMKKQVDGLIMLRDLAPDYLPKDFKYVDWDVVLKKYSILKGQQHCNITLHQIEMWLCEYGKYWKMEQGVGKARKKYTPYKASKL